MIKINSKILAKNVSPIFSLLLILEMGFGQLQLDPPLKYLAMGDSYTIGASVGFNDRWPTQLSDSLNALGIEVDTTVYVARTGWTTNNLQGAISTSNLDSNFNLVSVLIGVNNQYQGQLFARYEEEFPSLIQTAKAFGNGNLKNVFVVSIPDYAFTPFGNGNVMISNQLDSYNNFAKKYCDSLGIPFYNITTISRQGLENSALVASDGLHPSSEQYTLWVSKILGEFRSDFITSYENLIVRNELIIYLDKSNKIVCRSGFYGDYYQIFSTNGSLQQEGFLTTESNLHDFGNGLYLIKVGNKLHKLWKR